MRGVLARLGVVTTGEAGYEKQFGLRLAARKPLDIGGNETSKLMVFPTVALESDGNTLERNRLVGEDGPLLVMEEDASMSTPKTRADAVGLVAVAAAGLMSSPALAKDNYVFGVCSRTVVRADGLVNDIKIDPESDGGSYLFEYHGKDSRYKAKLKSGSFFANAKVTFIDLPKHGELNVDSAPKSAEYNWFKYTPAEGYIGSDQFSMSVEKGGSRSK